MVPEHLNPNKVQGATCASVSDTLCCSEHPLGNYHFSLLLQRLNEGFRRTRMSYLVGNTVIEKYGIISLQPDELK